MKLNERIKWKFLTESHDNYEENRKVALELCATDVLFFINNFCFTYDPRGESEKTRHLPFLLYDFQEETIKKLVEHIEVGKDFLVEKSRDMGATWIICAVFYWGWRFKGWDLHVGSRKEDLVDKRGDINSVMEKIRYINNRLPKWLKTDLKEGTTDKTNLIKNPETGNSITGESNNPYFGTGGRFKAILFDEFSKWEQTDDFAWRSCGDATPCRIANSTPSERGMNCQFFKLIEQGIDKSRLHWTLHPDKRVGMYYEHLGNKIPLNPNSQEDMEKLEELLKSNIRVGSEWYDKECERRSDIEVAQELDIAYDASLSGTIFKVDLKEKVKLVTYRNDLPLFVGMDFGMDTTAIVWVQSDGKFYYVIDEYENKGVDIYHYIEVINAKPYKQAIYYGDPYSGGIKQMQSNNTVAQILMRHGIRMQLANRVSIMDRINASRAIMKDTIISKQCPLFIDMVQKWRFRKPVRNNDKPIPEHSIYSHLGEAFGYFSVGTRMGPTRVIKSRYSN